MLVSEIKYVGWPNNTQSSLGGRCTRDVLTADGSFIDRIRAGHEPQGQRAKHDIQSLQARRTTSRGKTSTIKKKNKNNTYKLINIITCALSVSYILTNARGQLGKWYRDENDDTNNNQTLKYIILLTCHRDTRVRPYTCYIVYNCECNLCYLCPHGAAPSKSMHRKTSIVVYNWWPTITTKALIYHYNMFSDPKPFAFRSFDTILQGLLCCSINCTQASCVLTDPLYGRFERISSSIQNDHYVTLNSTQRPMVVRSLPLGVSAWNLTEKLISEDSLETR